MRTQIVSGLVLAVALATPSFAQSPAPATAPATAPGRAVRLSIVEGQVRLSHVGKSGATRDLTDDAVANTPLFEGTGIQTGDDGRAEIQFEDGSIARIPPDSALTLTVLRPGSTELALNSGLGYFEIKSPGDPTTGPGTTGQIRVHFGSSDTVTAGSAIFRVRLDEPPGEVAVFDGSLHINGPAGANDLHGGESARLDTLAISESVEPDSWDSWNSDRDEALNAASGGATAATQGLPDGANPAWGDLNQNGNWYNVPDEGNVWSPYEASDSSWDPYGDGYWADTPGYGYTWVSGESWGYMPYSCGMWNWYSSFGWGWAPGGGCSPWWRRGIWGVNVGRYPGGWHSPVRPPRPRGGPGSRPGVIVRPVGPAPIIAVHRQGPAYDGVLPVRDRRTPVTIGSATVAPLRPVTSPSRPVYNHQPSQNYGRVVSGRFQNGGSQTGSSSRPAYTSPNQQPSGTARPSSGGYHPAPAPSRPAPAPRSYSPPPAPRSSPPPASRPR